VSLARGKSIAGDDLLSGQAWAGKSLENVGNPLIFRWNPRKMCEEWNL
jgi:hypothetical protein